MVDFGKITKLFLHVSLQPTPRMLPGDEISQELLLYPDGQCFFETFLKADGVDEIVQGRKIARQISETVMQQLYAECFKHFSYQLSNQESGGCGQWLVKIINEEQQSFVFRGRLPEQRGTGSDFERRFSKLLRQALDIPEVIAFDNDYRRPKLMALRFNYEESLTLATHDSEQQAHIRETITIQRKRKQIMYERQTPEGDHKQLQRSGAVVEFLDSLNHRHFQPRKKLTAESMNIITRHERYTCTLTYQTHEEVITGTFDAEELPRGYDLFIHGVQNLLQGEGAMFDSRRYRQGKRSVNDYIFLQVEFDSWGKGYHYLTDDDLIQVGDDVLVPVGLNNLPRIGNVIAKGYYSAAKAPFPVAKTKTIIRKATAEDWQRKET